MTNETVLPYTVTESGRVINSAGEVAIRYYMTIPHHIQVNGRDYVFVVNANICLAWVNPLDVDKLLAATKVCCGGQVNSGIYKLCDETHARRWLRISDR